MTNFLKIVIVGEKGVGKRTLSTYCGTDPRSSDFYIPEDLVNIKVRATSGKNYDLIIHDSLILEDMISVSDPKLIQNSIWEAVHNCHAVLFCYSVNDPHSLLNLAYWYTSVGVHLSQNTSIFLVGTKSDLEIKITSKDLQQVQERVKFVQMFEVSSTKAGCTRNMFVQVVDHIEKNLQNSSFTPRTKKPNLHSGNGHMKNGEGSYTKVMLSEIKQSESNNMKIVKGDDFPENPQSFEGILD